MSAHDNGGPAFPVECYWPAGEAEPSRGVQTGNHSGWAMGLSLRDYFAAKAMHAMVSQRCYPCDDYETPRAAYAMADAMLKERAA